MKIAKLQQIFALVTCLLLMLTVAINRDGRIFGKDIVQDKTPGNIETVYGQGEYTVISTKQIAKDITGYGGPVPINIFMKDNRIVKIEPQSNSESPDYFSNVVKSGFLSSWNGLTTKEAFAREVDAVSGATFSSTAIAGNVKRAMSYVDEAGIDTSGNSAQYMSFSFKFVATLFVVLCAMIIPLFIKNRRYRVAQLILNVAVLGFWSGSFISMELITNYLSNGINLTVSLIPVLLLIAAFVMPLFGRKSHYCNWICPLGSFQELIGGISPFKVKMSQKTVMYLTRFRQILWFAIMFVMWMGVGFGIMDYEPFSAFIFRQASLPVIIICSLFLLLSLFTPRPFCRFVCISGTLFKLSESSK